MVVTSSIVTSEESSGITIVVSRILSANVGRKLVATLPTFVFLLDFFFFEADFLAVLMLRGSDVSFSETTRVFFALYVLLLSSRAPTI